MLQHLRIRDLAVIEQVDLCLSRGLTALTGETGAGKSLIMDALSLLLGGRWQPGLQRAGAKETVIEGMFDLTDRPLVRARLAELELTAKDPQELLVRRVCSDNRSRVLVNGNLSSVAILSELGRGLMDMSGQHGQQSLLRADEHTRMLDAYARHELLQPYREAYRALERANAHRADLAARQTVAAERGEFLSFQLEQLRALAAVPGELEQLDQEVRRLSNADKLKEHLRTAEAALYGDDTSAFTQVARALQALEGILDLDATLPTQVASLAQTSEVIAEVARLAQRLADAVEHDDERLARAQDRLHALRTAVRRHGGSFDALLAKQAQLLGELSEHQDVGAALTAAEAACQERAAALTATARALTLARMQAAPGFAGEIVRELDALDLRGARLEVRWEQGVHDLGRQGAETATFFWSPNPGEALQPVHKTASGGELSRLMLAVKCVLREEDDIGSYVFDEIDAGIGGHVAQALGERLAQVARKHQVLVVTHSAPIAAKADHHVVASKAQADGRTVSRARLLDAKERPLELARMLAGDKATDSAQQVARELLQKRPSLAKRRAHGD